jgi:hypothetical protein
MRRAQVEAFGIAIAIVLIIFIVLLFIGFSANSKPANVKQEILYNRLAWDFVNAVIKTTSNKTTSNDCEMSVQDLLMDCATSKAITCGSTGSIDSCEYSEKAITKILDGSLGARNEDYNFSVKYNGAPIGINSISTNGIASCRNSNYANVPLSTGSGTLEVSIRICVK